VSPGFRLNHGLGTVARLFQAHRNPRVTRKGIGSCLNIQDFDPFAASLVFALVTELLDFCECTTLAALIESFCSAQVIAFSAQFALRRRRSRALLAWTWLCPRQFLSPA